jgi:hypothetical protein
MLRLFDDCVALLNALSQTAWFLLLLLLLRSMGQHGLKAVTTVDQIFVMCWLIGSSEMPLERDTHGNIIWFKKHLLALPK